MKMLSQAFKNDELTRNMNPEDRLTYHQKHSQPVMDEAKQYMTKLLKEHFIFYWVSYWFS